MRINLKKLIIILTIILSSVSQSENLLFSLSSDKQIYSTTEQPQLNALLYTKPDNSEYEFDVIPTLNGQSILVNKLDDFNFLTSPGTLNVGNYSWVVSVVLQDAMYAHDLKLAITYYQNQISLIDTELLTETDPNKIAELQLKKNNFLNQKNASTNKLNSIRKTVSAPKTLNFQIQ